MTPVDCNRDVVIDVDLALKLTNSGHHLNPNVCSTIRITFRGESSRNRLNGLRSQARFVVGRERIRGVFDTSYISTPALNGVAVNLKGLSALFQSHAGSMSSNHGLLYGETVLFLGPYSTFFGVFNRAHS